MLYHFTCLLNLPSILRDGISKGEVPVGHYDIRQAPNLTTNPNGEAVHYLSAVTDKTKVRLTVSIPAGDNSLESWSPVCAREKTAPAYRRKLQQGARGQTKFYYVYWGVVPPDWFT